LQLVSAQLAIINVFKNYHFKETDALLLLLFGFSFFHSCVCVFVWIVVCSYLAGVCANFNCYGHTSMIRTNSQPNKYIHRDRKMEKNYNIIVGQQFP
jgi:hypothetical protein